MPDYPTINTYCKLLSHFQPKINLDENHFIGKKVQARLLILNWYQAANIYTNEAALLFASTGYMT